MFIHFRKTCWCSEVHVSIYVGQDSRALQSIALYCGVVPKVSENIHTCTVFPSVKVSDEQRLIKESLANSRSLDRDTYPSTIISGRHDF